MLGFPASTEFGKRIPKQKLYENLNVSPALRRVFVDQIRLVYWRNKLAASTLNIAAGESVTEIEVFEVRLNDPQLDEAVLKQIDKEIPYHILFILTCDDKAQAWIGYKEAAASGSNAFKVGRYYHTEWMPEDELHLSIDGLNMDAVYESLVRQIAGDKLLTDSGESLKESVEREGRKPRLRGKGSCLPRHDRARYARVDQSYRRGSGFCGLPRRVYPSYHGRLRRRAKEHSARCERPADDSP